MSKLRDWIEFTAGLGLLAGSSFWLGSTFERWRRQPRRERRSDLAEFYSRRDEA